MNKQSGSAHVVIIAVLSIALVGLLGFVFWQNFIQKDVAVTKNEATKSKPIQSSEPQKILEISEIDKSLDLTNAPYTDVTYEMTSVNSDDMDKYVVAIYSKDLTNRMVREASQSNNDIDYSTTYWKLAGNRAVYAYYYEMPSNSSGPEMIDGVASNIIDPTAKSDSSKFYIGFMGPGAPQNEGLNEESLAFLDWVKSSLK